MLDDTIWSIVSDRDICEVFLFLTYAYRHSCYK
jgi:hypothetical protein